MTQNHMPIPWDNSKTNKNLINANLNVKTSLVGRVGLMMLSCGTGAWRVREAMNNVARTLNIFCSADIGLVSIEYTCFDHGQSDARALSIPTTGINTIKLKELEDFMRKFKKYGKNMNAIEVNKQLDKINSASNNYSNLFISIFAGLACGAFVFLLGGGVTEIICCIISALIGKYIQLILGKKKIINLVGVSFAAASSCICYALILKILKIVFNVSTLNEAGYIGAMLFIVPGFPFITSGLDIAKLDMRSGIERSLYSTTIIIVATLVGWLVALTANLTPNKLISLNLPYILIIILRLIASFIGVFGFSIIYNSTFKMASLSGFVGAIANTFRLELLNIINIPPCLAAFLGALIAGLLASLIKKEDGYPRITITIPSIVIMVPGLFFYKSIYYFGNLSFFSGINYFIQSFLIVVSLPLGLMAARAITDKNWRYIN